MKVERQKNSLLLLILLVLFLCNGRVIGQIRAGSAFLKMLPGARLQAMAGSYSGGLDETYALFANPGATGFLREWNWAVSYNKWIADVYNASLIHGRKVRMPWSRQTQIALGIVYYGVPEFNSAGQNIQTASASDVLASLSVGQPLSFLSDRIAIGSNIKYYRSKLYTFEANTLIFDAGLIAQSPRFRLGNPIFDYGILSVGCALTQIGKNIKFDMVGTPLPQTWRVGAGLYLGKHNGFQLRIISDYQKVRDEEGGFAVGAEFSYNERFAINSGYNFNNDLLKSFSFGVSIRLDDVTTSEKTIIPGRNKALQFDVATIDADQMFSRTYRGDVKYFPVSPESFRHFKPGIGDTVKQNVIALKWEKSRDPDLFDVVKYTVVIDKDSLKLDQLIQSYERSGDDFWLALNDSVYQNIITTETDSIRIEQLKGGYYYWLVCAHDLDNHVRFAEIKNRKISNFYIPKPIIEIKKIAFQPDEWITTNDFQGNLQIIIENSGSIPVTDFKLVVKDSVVSDFDKTKYATNGSFHLVGEFEIDALEPAQSKTIEVPWYAKIIGEYKINVVVIKNDREAEQCLGELHENFYSIPKGAVNSKKEIVAMDVSTNSIEIPLITHLTFNRNSSAVRTEYLENTNLTATLSILSQRLKMNRHLGIALKGYADPNSGEEDVALANLRADAVKEALINQGVFETQIEVLPGTVLPRRNVPANPTDAEWIFEERRYVEITTDPSNHQILFGSVFHSDNHVDVKPISFEANIEGYISIEQTRLTQYYEEMSDFVPIDVDYKQTDIIEEIIWNLTSNQDVADWLDKNINSYLTLTDSLGRTFRTKIKNIRLERKDIGRKHRISFPLKFGKTEPMYDFYWQKLYQYTTEFLDDKDARMYFTGHACAVGPESVNNVLSRRRAKRFHEEFLRRLKQQRPDQFSKVRTRIKASTGYGESSPLNLETLSGERILIGDNATSHGRKLNRRIELVLVYNSE